MNKAVDRIVSERLFKLSGTIDYQRNRIKEMTAELEAEREVLEQMLKEEKELRGFRAAQEFDSKAPIHDYIWIPEEDFPNA